MLGIEYNDLGVCLAMLKKLRTESDTFFECSELDEPDPPHAIREKRNIIIRVEKYVFMIKNFII